MIQLSNCDQIHNLEILIEEKKPLFDFSFSFHCAKSTGRKFLNERWAWERQSSIDS